MSAVVGSIAGKWTEASIENFEAFMKELGKLATCMLGEDFVAMSKQTNKE